MSTRDRKLSKSEIQQAFEGQGQGQGATNVTPILSPQGLADLLQMSVSTVYEWIAKGRLDGAFRRRGKHIRIWRDRALDLFFNGPEWNHD
jgi:excisionase family DNA binding protein